MKNLICLLICFSFSLSIFSQSTLTTEQQAGLYQAFLQNDVSLWKKGIEEMEKQYETSKDIDLLYEITNAYYGMAGTCMGNKETEKAKTAIASADKNMVVLIKEKGDSPDVHALQAGIYGLQMGFSPMKGMTLGPKSTKHINKSLKLDEESPKGNYQMGGSYFYTPALFGGSTKKAIRYYKKSVECFEKVGELENNWEYLTALTWLGMAYKQYEDMPNAKSTFEKALAFEPNHKWVEKVLLPSVSE